ncbi:exo-alpha-sialidase [Arthrobacter oryzae]|uniref:exo-alpha-sialidase n=1 Tax=Arthrobacter oryzae TaxID=409290 RepID=A0A3N0BMI6_9MICC|nr:exo-alpha-sialidase [Arthrobacter oryzae]RNL49888.1 sialidase [Arthrobacter oryzae]
MTLRKTSGVPRLRARAVAGILGLGLVAGSGLPAAAAPIPPSTPTAGPGEFSESNIAADRTPDNLFYRIPALTYLGGGVVLAAWDGRPGSAADAPNPNSIVQRRSTDSGRTWGPQQVIAAGHVGDASGPKFGYSDPSYIHDAETGKVFAFFVYSKDQGFGGSVFGNDDADRSVISSAIIESADGGQTWSSPRLITSITKPGTSRTNPQPGDVRSNFAASGEGIQLKYGIHRGRLIQQYSGMVLQANGSQAFQAYSVFSDDHGLTWQKGASVGAGMDENKTVELSDGRVMLNTRDSFNGGFRKVAFSNDGGATYGEVAQDTELPDPANNGAIARMFPEAPAGSAEAKKLIFTNANSKSGRQNVSARVSCDDGATWPGVRTIRAGFSAYSTVTRLEAGQFGVLYEANYTDNMPFAKFNDAWLNYVCAPLSVDAQAVTPGADKAVPVTVTNQESAVLSGGSATIYTPAGWSATTVPVPDVAPGASVTVSVNLSVPSGAAGAQNLNAAFTAANGNVAQHTFVATAPQAQQVGLSITGAAPDRDVMSSPYKAGDVLAYSFTVRNTGSVTSNAVPTGGNFETGYFPPTAPNCRYNNLSAGSTYSCTTARHTLTEEDISRGYFAPQATFTVTASATPSLTQAVAFNGANIALRDGLAMADISGRRNDEGRDLALQPYAAGDQVPYAFAVTNSGPLTTTVTPTAGNFAPLVPEGAGNCRWRNLAPAGRYNCTTPRHTVTQAEADQGFFVPRTSWTLTVPGQSPKVLEVDGGEVDLVARNALLDGTAAAAWDDANDDGYATAGEKVTFTYMLGNAGNVDLTDLQAPGMGITEPVFAAAATATRHEDYILTAADVDAGELPAASFTVTARNGSKTVALTVTREALALRAQPARPEAIPTLQTQDLDGGTAPTGLGTDDKYRTGQKVTLHNLEHGQWYYVYLNKGLYRLGWIFPGRNDTVEFILPDDVKNGRDDVVVLDSRGQQVTFDRFQVTPKGQKP